MKLRIPRGSKSRIVTVFIQANNVATGAGLAGLIHTSGIVGGYVREGGVGVALAVDEDVTTEGTYQAPSTAAHVRIGTPANMRTGFYELHFHDDLWATGETITISLGGATNMAELALEIELSGNPNEIWRGTLAAIASGSVTFPAGHGIANHARIAVTLLAGTAAKAVSRHCAYSGSGNVWTPDPAWDSDGDTLPSGSLEAVVTAVPKEPTGALPRVDVRQFGGAAGTFNAGRPEVNASHVAGTAQTAADVGVLPTRLSSARAGYLDNLNVGGLVAASAEVTGIQNNTRVARVVPSFIERPDSGSEQIRIELTVYDSVGNMEAPDSAPTLAIVNHAGTSRDGNLDNVIGQLVSTGRYRWLYTVSSAHALEQLVYAFSVVEGGATRVYVNPSLVVDTTAVDFTSADRTQLQALFGKLPSKNYLAGTNNADGDVQINEATGTPADSAGVTTILGLLDTEIASLISAVAAVPAAAAAAVRTNLETIGDSEPVAVPAFDAPPLVKLRWVFHLARARVEQTATEQTLLTSAAAPLAIAAVSDAGGTLAREAWEAAP